jgi:hypothetical protein
MFSLDDLFSLDIGCSFLRYWIRLISYQSTSNTKVTPIRLSDNRINALFFSDGFYLESTPVLGKLRVWIRKLTSIQFLLRMSIMAIVKPKIMPLESILLCQRTIQKII